MNWKRKAFEQNWVAMMIFSFFSLFVLLIVFVNLSGTADSSDVKACSLLFSTGLSNNAFYASNLTNFNQNFFDFTEGKCQSFELDVEDRNVDLVVDKINSCWKTLDSGNVILPREMFGEGICYYCGELKRDDSFDFEILQKSLSEKENGILNDFQNTKITEENIGVFYYQYRENLDTFDSIGNYIDSKISSYGGLLNRVGDIFQPDIRIYTGITFAELRGDDKNEFYLDGVPLNEKLNCRTIVPDN
jgi:hypothetical protein